MNWSENGEIDLCSRVASSNKSSSDDIDYLTNLSRSDSFLLEESMQIEKGCVFVDDH